MSEYSNKLIEELNALRDDKQTFNDTKIINSNNNFAKYLKENFNKELIMIENNIEKEKNKGFFKKLIERFNKVL